MRIYPVGKLLAGFSKNTMNLVKCWFNKGFELLTMSLSFHLRFELQNDPCLFDTRKHSGQWKAWFSFALLLTKYFYLWKAENKMGRDLFLCIIRSISVLLWISEQLSHPHSKNRLYSSDHELSHWKVYVCVCVFSC